MALKTIQSPEWTIQKALVMAENKSPLSLADAFSYVLIASPLYSALSTKIGYDINADYTVEHNDRKSIKLMKVSWTVSLNLKMHQLG